MQMINKADIARIPLPCFFWHFHWRKTGLHSTVVPPCWIKSREGRISIPVFSPLLPSVVYLSKSKHRVTVPGASATPTNALKQRPSSVQLEPWNPLCKKRKPCAKRENNFSKSPASEVTVELLKLELRTRCQNKGRRRLQVRCMYIITSIYAVCENHLRLI